MTRTHVRDAIESFRQRYNFELQQFHTSEPGGVAANRNFDVVSSQPAIDKYMHAVPNKITEQQKKKTRTITQWIETSINLLFCCWALHACVCVCVCDRADRCRWHCAVLCGGISVYTQLNQLAHS